MKPYQVVGIGNALVDVICPVEDGFLAANGVTKGIMQLIDLERSAELYAAMGPAPAISGGSVANSIGGLSGPWHISAKTENPDLGAEWLNYVITSQRAKTLMFSQQQLPADRRAKPPSGDPYLASVHRAFKLVADDDGLLLYTDWASPSMYTTLQNQFQLLLAGRQTPAGMAKAVQDDWAKFDKTLR